MTRYFSEEEVEDLVFSNDVVDVESMGSRRWVEGMISVVRADDDKLYRIAWDRGLTEYQENYYPEGDCPEVHRSVELTVKEEVSYLTDRELADKRAREAPGIHDDIESLKLVSDANAVNECFSPETIKKVEDALELLGSLSPLDAVGSFAQYREASQQYLKSIRDYATMLSSDKEEA